MLKNILFLFFCFSISQVYAQDPIKEAWYKAKELCNEGEYNAAKPYLLKVYKEMPRPLCCYFLGVTYDVNNDVDSALYYYQIGIKNSRKPQLSSLDNIIRLYLRQGNLEKAYELALDAIKKYPNNAVMIDEFKQVCQWSYFIKHRDLSIDYLKMPKGLESYKVNTVTEQYLIIKNLRNEKNQPFNVGNRGYKGTFELWKGKFNQSKEEVTLKFELVDHNLDRGLEAQTKHAKTTYNDDKEDIPVRIGALLAIMPLDDKQMLSVLDSKEFEIRYCACSEVQAKHSNKVKKKCKADADENIRILTESLSAFK
ncbi:MAG: hypothetical protein GY810_25700 [Aureispira sp.]|nr:hypothetical protein [Aureispira sp.]